MLRTDGLTLRESDLACETRDHILSQFTFVARTTSEWIARWGLKRAAQMIRDSNWSCRWTKLAFRTAWEDPDLSEGR